jgi:hypothetical protein
MNSWAIEASELRVYFRSITLPTVPVRLNCCSVITSVPVFLNSHFAVLKKNDTNATFESFLIILRELKEKLKNIKNE